MGYTLYGSQTSPFARRVRLAMEQIPHDFRNIDVYDGAAGSAEIHKVNPLNQIPCLVDGQQPVWDSKVILQYLGKKHGWNELTIDQQNRLSAIDGMLDGGVVIALSRRSKIDLTGMYADRINARIASVMEWLTPWMKSSEAKEWNVLTQTLYSAIDWMQFRDIHPSAKSPEAQAFIQQFAERSIIKDTDPRKA